MAKQSIGLGSVADDGTGDTLRVAGDKINDNFDELYTTLGDGSTLTSVAVTAINNATANELVTIGATTTELDAEANLTFDGSTLAVTGAATVSGLTTLSGNLIIPNDGDIGSVGATDAIQISSAGIITFKDDILIKDGGTIGVASATTAITIASTGIVTLVDDLILKDAATIGVTSSTSAISIASTGIVTFVDDIIIKDAGTIGSASDTDAISISAAGVITLSSTTDSTSASTGSLVTHSIGVADDASFGDQVTLFGASGKVKRDGTAAFIVIEAGGTDGAGTHAGDNIIDETDSDDIILEDQIFHHTGHSSVSLTIFDSGGAIVKSLIGVHQDTSELN